MAHTPEFSAQLYNQEENGEIHPIELSGFKVLNLGQTLKF